MPTLHLIDVERHQACPAVLAAVRQAMDGDDQLLILGPRAVHEQARRLGISSVDYRAAPFGKAPLAVPALRRWARRHPRPDRVHGWSVGALRAGMAVYRHKPCILSLPHRPTEAQTRFLARLGRKQLSALRVRVDHEALGQRLRADGVSCSVGPLVDPGQQSRPMSAAERATMRNRWGVHNEHERVVLLLSDTPELADAVQAVEVAVLGGATQTDAAGDPMRVSILVHPCQRHRRRADEFLAHQPAPIRLLQDARGVEPWRVLGACDAALALGPDAGGLSLRYALHAGVPTVADRLGPAVAMPPSDALHLARSAQTKDLAHQLHRALNAATPCLSA